MQQRYLVFCCKSRKVQLCLQSSAEAVHHQGCCCFLPPAVMLVILCSSCSDWPPGRKPTLRNVWGLHSFKIKTAYLPPIPCGLWALLTLWQLTACFFITVCESLLVGIRKWLCLFTYLERKLMWHLHHPDLASGPQNSLWSLFGLVSPQPKNVIIWPILCLD